MSDITEIVDDVAEMLRDGVVWLPAASRQEARYFETVLRNHLMSRGIHARFTVSYYAAVDRDEAGHGVAIEEFYRVPDWALPGEVKR